MTPTVGQVARVLAGASLARAEGFRQKAEAVLELFAPLLAEREQLVIANQHWHARVAQLKADVIAALRARDEEASHA